MKYRTKPFEIEAIKFTGDNWDEILKFVGSRRASDNSDYSIPNFAHVTDYWPAWEYDPEIISVVWDKLHSTWVGVRIGDYIIKGMKGEFYPCAAEVFEAKYELIEEGNWDCKLPVPKEIDE